VELLLRNVCSYPLPWVLLLLLLLLREREREREREFFTFEIQVPYQIDEFKILLCGLLHFLYGVL
jgi:hypothetical protein